MPISMLYHWANSQAIIVGIVIVEHFTIGSIIRVVDLVGDFEKGKRHREKPAAKTAQPAIDSRSGVQIVVSGFVNNCVIGQAKKRKQDQADRNDERVFGMRSQGQQGKQKDRYRDSNDQVL